MTIIFACGLLSAFVSVLGLYSVLCFMIENDPDEIVYADGIVGAAISFSLSIIISLVLVGFAVHG